jgi:hypothetical protein
MQIHELTEKRRTAPPVPVYEAFEGLKSWASDIAAPYTLRKKQAEQEALGASANPEAVAQKAQAIWTKYVQDWEADLTDPQEKADFLSRKDGMYKKQLLAFVQKNLLPNVDINRVINRNVILNIVDSLSAPAAAAGTPAATAPAGTPAATAPAGTPAALAQSRAAKQKAAAAKARAELTANPKNPPVTEALDPAAEAALWKRLAGEIRRAQVDVDQSRPAAAQGSSAATTTGQAQLASALSQQYSRAAGAAAALGKAAVANAGTSTQAKSTGNAAADAVLQLAGFQIS